MRGNYKRLGPEHDDAAQGAGHVDWRAWVEALEKSRGYEICGRRKRSAFAPCESRATEVGPCANHARGPIGLVGPANPAYKDGSRSDYTLRALPERLRAKALAAYTDPELISLRQEIAIATTRLGELVGNLSTGESGQAWAVIATKLGDALGAVSKAQGVEGDAQAEHLAGARRALAVAYEVAQEGLGDRRVWKEVVDLQEHIARLKTVERERMKALGQFVIASRVTTLLDTVVERLTARAKQYNAPAAMVSALARDVAHLASQGAADDATPGDG